MGKKVYLKIKMYHENLVNSIYLTELSDIVRGIEADSEIILQLQYAEQGEANNEQNQGQVVIEYPSDRESNNQGQNDQASNFELNPQAALARSLMQWNFDEHTILLDTLDNILGNIIEIEVLGTGQTQPDINNMTNPNDIMSALFGAFESLTMQNLTGLPKIRNFIDSMANRMPDKSRVKHITIKLNNEGIPKLLDDTITSLAKLTGHLSLQYEGGVSFSANNNHVLDRVLQGLDSLKGHKLKTIELSHNIQTGGAQRFDYEIKDLFRANQILGRKGVKLSIKNADVSIEKVHGYKHFGKSGFIERSNQLSKFFEHLIDSDIVIKGNSPEDYIWRNKQEKELVLKSIIKALNNASEANGNYIAIEGFTQGGGINMDAVIEVLEDGNMEGSHDIRELDLLAEIAELRNNQEALEEINYLLQQEHLKRLGGEQGNLYFHGRLMPEEVLCNIISFIPRNLERDTNTFTREQMDIIASKLINEHYLKVLDTTTFNNVLENSGLINHELSTILSSAEQDGYAFVPILLSDDYWGDRWILYFHTGDNAQGSPRDFVIDPLLFSHTAGFDLFGSMIFSQYQGASIRDSQLGLQLFGDNSGAWVIYIMEKLQEELAKEEDLSSISLDNSWINNIFQEYPDAEEFTERYEEVYEEELMDMGDGGAYYREIGLIEGDEPESSLSSNSSTSLSGEEELEFGSPSFQNFGFDSLL